MNKSCSGGLIKFLALSLSLAATLLLGSCGGGISGSGDGDTTKERELIESYHITYFPIGYAAAIPASLIDRYDSDQNPFDESDPVVTVISNVNRVIDRTIAIALAQLYLDASWETILQYCEQTEQQPDCSLQGSGITTLYTKEMALWEANIRSRVEQYQQWHGEQPASDDFQQLYDAARAKVGTRIALDSVTLNATDDNTEYDYEVAIEIELPTPVAVTLQWNADLQSGSFATQSALNGEQTLSASFTISDGLAQHKFSLNQSIALAEPQVDFYTQQLPDTDRSFVDSKIKRVTDDATTEIASSGLANEMAGYLRSDKTTYSETENSVLSFRQSFEEQTTGTALCDPQQSTNNCEQDADWTTLSGEDPTLSNSFVSDGEIESIKQSYDVNIARYRLFVSRDSNIDSYAILDGRGVDEDDFDDFLEDVEDIADDRDLQSAESGITPNYDRIVLCRVENADDNSLDYLEFSCDTSAESLQNALVVVEEFDDGDLDLKLLQDQDFDIQVIE